MPKTGTSRRQKQRRSHKKKKDKSKEDGDIVTKEVEELVKTFTNLMNRSAGANTASIPTKRDFKNLEKFVKKELREASEEVKKEFARLGKESAATSDETLLRELNPKSNSEADVVEKILEELRDLADVVRELEDESL